MTKQEKYNAISNAMVSHSTKDIYIYSEKLEEEVKNKLQDIQFASEFGFELSYDIMYSACAVISDIPLEDLETVELSEHTNDSASVYTATRLSYLNINNQSEITDTMKEYACDIQTACAVWFDNQVLSYATQLVEYINE